MQGRLSIEEVGSYIGNCIHDEAAPCSCACPYGLDVRSLMKKLAKGRMSSAYKEFRTATVFPTIAAALCDHPCEKKCQRLLTGDDPLQIGRLEKAILQLAKPQAPDVFAIPEKPEKIAVVGAGPSGLSLALSMAQKKYQVTVFEKEDALGGSLREHPQFAVFEEDIRFQMSAESVAFCFGKQIGSLEELKSFQAVYIATGKGGEDFGLLPSWNEKDCTTKEQGCFLGGELCAQTVAGGIACGRNLSKIMESVIQTGRVIQEEQKKDCSAVSLVPADAEAAPAVQPSDPNGFNKDEVKTEAARCFLCNCDRCMTGCELMKQYKKPPLQAANETIADVGPHFLASRTMTRQTYSCSQCGYCESICPESIGMGNIFHVSRTERVIKEIQPEAFHDYWLRELDLVSGEAFYASLPENGKTYEYAFFPGCQAGGTLPAQVKKTGEWLKEEYQAGVILGCCGASAWWAGDEKRWEENTALLRNTWEKMGKPVLVLACATCADMLERFLPEIRTVSVYEMMAERFQAGDENRLFEEAALFDPCAARCNEPMKKGVRTLAELTGCNVHDLKETGRCCGWGGHMRTANPKLYEQIAKNRVNLDDLPYIVYCANCREVFLEQNKSCRHILEFVFGPEEKQYTIHQKKENRLDLKDSFSMLYEGKKEIRAMNEWDGLQITLSDELRKETEERLISDDDIKECIWRSENGEGRFAGEDGSYLASMSKKVVTYWVEYRETNGVYEILNAYSHRMKIVVG